MAKLKRFQQPAFGDEFDLAQKKGWYNCCSLSTLDIGYSDERRPTQGSLVCQDTLH
jgi:hypothetical protein